MALSPFLTSMLGGGQSPFTPGINPNAPNPQQQQPSNPLMGLLNKPGGSFLMNLLAQQGFSTMPSSPFAAIGRAGLATQQQEAAKAQSELQRRLIESRIGLANAQAQSPAAAGRRVHSAQTLENGNIGFLDAFTGEVVDTGKKSGTRTQIVDVEGQGKFVFNPVEQSLTPVANEGTIQSGLAGRAGSQEAARQGAITEAIPEQVTARIGATDRAQSAIEVSGASNKTQRFIKEGEEFIDKLESGDLKTGPFIGMTPALTTNAQLFEAWSGEQVLDRISEATFGALSEGEREFLASTVTGRGKTEEANIELIRRKIEILQDAENRVRGRAGDTSSVSEKPISEMTDAELEAIINGG